MRKKPFIIILLAAAGIILAAALPGCDGAGKRKASLWPQIDRPTDSLSARMDYLLISGASDESVKATLDSLRAQMALVDAPDLPRLQFFEAETISNRSRRTEELEKLHKLANPAKYPYLHHRITHAIHTREPNTAEAYRAFLDNMAYFRDAGDSLMTAMSFVNLTALMISLADSTAAIEYWRRADNIFDELQLPTLRLRNRINLVLIYAAAGNMDQTIAESAKLLDDPSLRNDLKARELILRNHYFFTDSLPLVREILRITAHHADFAQLRGLHMSMVADWYRRHGEPDSAMKYGHMAMAEYGSVHGTGYRAFIMHNYAQLIKEHGSLDSTVIYLERARLAMDSVMESRDVVNVKNLELQRRLAVQELEGAQRTHRRTVGWIIAFLILIICGLSAWLFFYRRHVALEKAMLIKTRENEQTQRHAAAASLAAEEKDSMLQKIKEDINQLSEADSLTRNDIHRLLSSIASTDADSPEWDSYLKIIEQVNPQFLKNLKKRCSTLSPNNIQLACYIYLGMTPRQIAHLTKIRPESVHQARWRLRVKLGVASDEALDQLLSRLGSE